MDLCSQSHQGALSTSEAWRSHCSAQGSVPGRDGTRENGNEMTIWRRQNQVERNAKKSPIEGQAESVRSTCGQKQGKRVAMCNPLSTDHLRVRVQRDWTLGAQRWSEQAHLLQRGSRCSMGEDSSDRSEPCVIGLDENHIGLGRSAREYGPSI